MQELIEMLIKKDSFNGIYNYDYYLEKEKQAIIEARADAPLVKYSDNDEYYKEGERYFNNKFKTDET